MQQQPLTDRLTWLISEYFPAPVEATPGEWNNWGTPAEADGDLLRRAWGSHSAGAVFGNHARASFAALWDADSAALALAYPDPSGARAYDSSSADAALAQHLAFWTRRDHERIRRLMWQSKLAREKWNRDDYLPRTIIKACAMQTTVLQPDRPPVASPVVDMVQTADGAAVQSDQVQSAAPAPTVQNIDTFLTPDEQANYFHGCVYIVSLNRVLIPGGHMLNQQQFDVVFGGKTFALDAANTKVAKGAWDALTHSQALKHPRADAPCFRPEELPGAMIQDGGRSMINTYWPITVASAPGDITPFANHMAKLFPVATDRAVIEAYLAALVQFPGDKFQWWPLIQGAEGNGKSLILAVAEHAVGHRYCHRPNAQDLGGNGGKFTAWIQGRILIGIEEIKVSNRTELLELLKPMVTNSLLEIQPKGTDQYTGDNRANGLLFTNYKDAIPQRIDGRRYAVFFTPHQSLIDIEADGMGGDYFPKLYAWLRGGGYANVTHWLKTYAIPAALSPAMLHGGELNRAPRTSSTVEAVSVSMGRLEQEILNAVASGEPGFCGGWVSSVMLGKLIKDVGGRNMAPSKLAEMLKGLGYVPHPALPGGRVNNVVSPDGKKPVLYVKADSIAALNVVQAADVARMYTAAQPGAFGQPGAMPGGVPLPPVMG